MFCYDETPATGGGADACAWKRCVKLYFHQLERFRRQKLKQNQNLDVNSCLIPRLDVHIIGSKCYNVDCLEKEAQVHKGS